MNTRSITHIRLLMLCIVLFSGVFAAHTQTLRKPTPQFTSPCASSGFNTFQVNFTWETPLVNSDNQFILELSDANGSFSSPTQLASVNNQNTTLDFDFNFSFPTSTRGENYRVRVRSTSPALTSPVSDPFPAYYQNVTQNLIINGFNATEVVCDGSFVTLSVDNFPGEPSYRWFKNRNITPMPGETGPTLQVTDEGFYYVEVDYGDFCSFSTASNEVEVIMATPVGIAINGPSNVELCPGFAYQLTANVDDPSLIYRWFKDGTLLNVPPGYQPTLSVDPSDPAGTYTLEIESGGGCRETAAPVVITVPSINVSISPSVTTLLLPGDNVIFTVTTTADTPSYAWYRDGVLLSGENSDTLIASGPGTYQAEVTQGVGCAVVERSPEIDVELPQSFNMTISTLESYTDCENSAVTLVIEKIEAVTSTNQLIDVTAQLQGSFTYQWEKDGTDLSGENNDHMSLPDASLNGKYVLKADLGAFHVVSNEFDVRMTFSQQDPVIQSDDVVSCDGGSDITITSDFTDPGYTYTWFRNGTALASETSPTLTINLTGTYRLEVAAFGCTVTSNEIIINPFEDSIVTVDAPENIVIQEGSLRIITASGADSYRWFNEENVEISSAASVTLSEEGQYVLRASVGNCEVIKTFTVMFNDNFAVPNVISPNSDGINDLWVIPNRYAFNPDVQVFIYGASGETIFATSSYQNNWPESNLSYPVNKPVFYYKIVRGKEILKQGTITLIR
ncbi:gliding motility-associated C-terminal domain-containing protein [Leptobacterium flavescens]|uniref:Gliding motility-associated C-terminal domain-containing protein n=1 Tax=Leptobacterium flavescens TaxID=472055 RepID=A0A6P0UMG5_9FLAO|nr:gliding motility-associated C-terminal domain-containing protein [Leptobacterium flavescens]NER14207.1 gliding motility-associated C-terminal domain-containing protein [Leptobacterium flavescens]